MYASKSDYFNIYRGTSIPEDSLESELERAETDIDGLTYNRIRVKGFDALTEYQQDLVRRATCEQADFRHNYGDLLASPLSSYGINGISMQFDSKSVVERGGVKAPNQVLSLLRSAGLTYLGV